MPADGQNALMHMFQQAGLTVFQFATFVGRQGIRHGIFGRHGGVSRGGCASLNLSLSVKDDPLAVHENRRRAYGAFQRDMQTLVHAHLIHQAQIALVTRAEHGQVMSQADGLITNDPGCGLTMNFADCAPIFLYDPVHHAIGLGHAGWKGSLVDLPGQLVRAMQAAYGSTPKQLLAAIGPCISVERYEVGEPLVSAVRATFPEAVDQLLVYPQPGGRPHYNLMLANRLNLERSGVRHIEIAPWCTADRTDLFFSHRAEAGQTGRFGAVFMLDES